MAYKPNKILAKIVNTPQVNSTTTYAIASELVFNLKANSKYIIDCLFLYSSTGDGVKVTLGGTVGHSTYAAKRPSGIIIQTLGADIHSTSGVNLFDGFTINGAIITTTAGTFSLRFATNTGGATNTSLLEGSYLKLIELT